MYRTRDRLLGDCVRVGWSAGDAAPVLRRDLYESLGGQPPYDQLPTREVYRRGANPIEPDPLESD
ncbi:hypothetical protein ACFOON_01300 [Novosphingobium piscinae]|uniref:hypothetical protein n=1 Tax=Novosphingobium piscinae TaxID=1507448 RepID=UPI001FECEBA9|nr:hypothetical protein [Novosphingobium piscinae]